MSDPGPRPPGTPLEQAVARLEQLLERMDGAAGLTDEELAALAEQWRLGVATLHQLTEGVQRGDPANAAVRQRLQGVVERMAGVRQRLAALQSQVAGQLMGEDRRIRQLRDERKGLQGPGNFHLKA